MGGLYHVPKSMSIISYAFNIALLIVIVVKVYPSDFNKFMSAWLSKCSIKPLLCILLEGFIEFPVDP